LKRERIPEINKSEFEFGQNKEGEKKNMYLYTMDLGGDGKKGRIRKKKNKCYACWPSHNLLQTRKGTKEKEG
jgi:prenyltransferase beta subunit